MRTGLNLCSGAILPRGFHHSAASAEKRSTSAGSTVLWWDVRAIPDFSWALLVNPAAWLQRPDPVGMYTRLFRPALHRVCAGLCPGMRRLARLVMKFGGTSVAAIDRIRNVAHH